MLFPIMAIEMRARIKQFLAFLTFDDITRDESTDILLWLRGMTLLLILHII